MSSSVLGGDGDSTLVVSSVFSVVDGSTDSTLVVSSVFSVVDGSTDSTLVVSSVFSVVDGSTDSTLVVSSVFSVVDGSTDSTLVVSSVFSVVDGSTGGRLADRLQLQQVLSLDVFSSTTHEISHSLKNSSSGKYKTAGRALQSATNSFNCVTFAGSIDMTCSNVFLQHV